MAAKITQNMHKRIEISKEFTDALLDRYHPDYMLITDAHTKYSLSKAADQQNGPIVLNDTDTANFRSGQRVLDEILNDMIWPQDRLPTFLLTMPAETSFLESAIERIRAQKWRCVLTILQLTNETKEDLRVWSEVLHHPLRRSKMWKYVGETTIGIRSAPIRLYRPGRKPVLGNAADRLGTRGFIPLDQMFFIDVIWPHEPVTKHTQIEWNWAPSTIHSVQALSSSLHAQHLKVDMVSNQMNALMVSGTVTHYRTLLPVGGRLEFQVRRSPASTQAFPRVIYTFTAYNVEAQFLVDLRDRLLTQNPEMACYGPGLPSDSEYVMYGKATASELLSFGKDLAQGVRFMSQRLVILTDIHIDEVQLLANADGWKGNAGGESFEIFKDDGLDVASVWKRRRFTATRARLEGLQQADDYEVELILQNTIAAIGIDPPCIERYVKGHARARGLGVTCSTPGQLQALIRGLDKLSFRLLNNEEARVKIVPFSGELTVPGGHDIIQVLGQPRVKKEQKGSGSTWAQAAAAAFGTIPTTATSGTQPAQGSGNASNANGNLPSVPASDSTTSQPAQGTGNTSNASGNSTGDATNVQSIGSSSAPGSASAGVTSGSTPTPEAGVTEPEAGAADSSGQASPAPALGGGGSTVNGARTWGAVTSPTVGSGVAGKVPAPIKQYSGVVRGRSETPPGSGDFGTPVSSPIRKATKDGEAEETIQEEISPEKQAQEAEDNMSLDSLLAKTKEGVA